MTNFHSISAKICLTELKSSLKGLSLKEAKARFKKNGPNELEQKKKFSKIMLFIRQFKSPFIYILLLAGFASLILNEVSNASVIFGAVVLNALIGFFQENKANNALEKLREMVEHQAIVFREGKERKIDAREVVVGDIILIEAGSRLPADGRLLEASELSVNEAALTGESYPASKITDKVGAGASLPDRKNMVYAGTIAVAGRGRAVITATAKNTEVGKISKMIFGQEEERTPLQNKLEGLAKFLAVMFLVICTLVVVLGVIEGRGLYDMFLVGVALAVSSIPEGLLISMTFILIVGMQRLLKEKVLTRKLVSAETLGSTTVICTDKTGTLTEGKMVVSHIIIGEKEFEVDNPGSRQDGDEAKIVSLALQIGAMCNNAIIENPDEPLKAWRFFGTPTETALLKAGYEAGIDREEMSKSEVRLAEKQFTSADKFMITAHKRNSHFVIYEKGAPEMILEKSDKFYHLGELTPLTSAHKTRILENFEKLTAVGFRLIAVAFREFDENLFSKEKVDWAEVDKELSYVGLIAIKDPLRKDASQAIAEAREAGIRPVVITGDHQLTALAIGKEIGLSGKKEELLTGEELDNMDDAQLLKVCNKISIYARVTPHHKLRIVNALRQRGEVVAMVGDGINDAPALKAADVGVALGNGTDVAKEASDMILLDNNFKVVVAAVQEGRRIFSSMRRVITYLNSGAFSEIVLVTGAIVLATPLPIIPVQILWLNIINDGLPNFSLSFEKITKTMMERKPKGRNAPLLSLEMKTIIFLVSLLVDVLILIFFLSLLKTGVKIEYLQTLIFAILGTKSLVSIFGLRSLSRPIWKMNPFSNLWLWGAVATSAALCLLAIYWPPLQHLLSTTPLAGKDWLIVFVFSGVNLFLIEVTKFIFSKVKSLKD